MCEMCQAKTENYTKDINDRFLGLYNLVRATQDGDMMEKDEWGLVITNYPSFCFREMAYPSPFVNHTDEELNKLSHEDEMMLSTWESKCSEFWIELHNSVDGRYFATTILNLYAIAQADGFDHFLPEKSKYKSFNFEQWFYHKLGIYMLQHQEVQKEQ